MDYQKDIEDLLQSQHTIVTTRQCPRCGMVVSAKTARCPQDGTDLLVNDDKEVLADATLAHKYEFVKQIGEGGMGAVFEVRHRMMHKPMAIKIIHNSMNSPSGLKRFKREAETAMLLRHPGIVAVHDFGISEHNQAFIVMDYVAGEALQTWVHQHGPLQLQPAVQMFERLADALQHAHEQGIIHRDIKPANIMVEGQPDGKLQARIVDFGIAKVYADATDGTLTATGEVVGSPVYMSPEQMAGTELQAVSDVYSLGATLFFALTGRAPHQADNVMQIMHKKMFEAPPRLRDCIKADYPDSLDDLFHRALARDAERRYKSMAQMREALLAVAADLRAGVKGGRRSSASNNPARTVKQFKLPHPVVMVSAIAIAMIVGLVGYLEIKGVYHEPAKTLPQTSPLAVPAPPVVAQKKKVEFKSITMGERELATIVAQKGCRTLRLNNVRFAPNLKWAEAFAKMPNLTALALIQAGPITESDCAQLAKSQTIKYLDLSGTNVTDACLSKLASSPSLTHLYLYNAVNVTGEFVKSFHNSKLSELYFPGTALNAKTLAYLPQAFPVLTLADLHDTDLKASDLLPLAQNRMLQWLIVDGKMDEASVNAIKTKLPGVGIKVDRSTPP